MFFPFWCKKACVEERARTEARTWRVVSAPLVSPPVVGASVSSWARALTTSSSNSVSTHQPALIVNIEFSAKERKWPHVRLRTPTVSPKERRPNPRGHKQPSDHDGVIQLVQQLRSGQGRRRGSSHQRRSLPPAPKRHDDAFTTPSSDHGKIRGRGGTYGSSHSHTPTKKLHY